MRPRSLSALRPPAVLAALALLAAGCGSSAASTSSASSSPSVSSSSAASAPSSAAASAPAAHSHSVKLAITNFAYAPSTISVAAGTKVTWVNHDSTAHTATAAGTFDTGSIAPGKSASVTLSKPGTYHYICSFHPFMHGTIVVK